MLLGVFLVILSDEEAEDEASSEEENDETCAVCGSGGTLICCDNCPLSYHLGCAQPPLKKVPKKKWLCQICSGEDSKTGKIKFLAAPKSKYGVCIAPDKTLFSTEKN